MKGRKTYPQYGIAAVRLNQQGCIVQLLVYHIKASGGMSKLGWLSRGMVIDQIEHQVIYFTLLKDPLWGVLKIGARVHVVEAGARKFLRTDRERVPADCLQGLPEPEAI